MKLPPRPPVSRSLVHSLLLLATCVVALNAWFAFRSVQALRNSEIWVEHTWQVINQVEQIVNSTVEAETGHRGYLLTGDASYLEPYNEAVKDLPGQLDRFQQLTADNASQRVRIIQLRSILSLRLATLQQGIDLRRSGNVTGVQALVTSGTGIPHMQRVRQIAGYMEAEEQRLLVDRTAETHTVSIRARFAVVFASTLDFILIILMFRYFAFERRQRVLAEQAAHELAASRLLLEAKSAEIQALNVSLEERVRLRTAELETTNRELEAFSYSVSHDLRAPLRTIDGFSLALAEDYAGVIDSVGQDYIQRVRAGVQRMGGLIDALLQLSRITRAEISREEIDLSTLALGVADNLRDEHPGQALSFHIEPNLKANGDPKLLRVALENLMGNAVKFSSKKPETIVDFGWDPEQRAWFVRDFGAGFDMYYAEKLFNAFNRLHGDKDFKGSGIGLATVARVIRRHHGRIWADSTIDHGATFWFTLG